MENAEKKYLTLPKKLAYGSGDFGSNFFYMLVSSFAMLYLTNSVGLSAGIVGAVMLISKLCDGVADVVFGKMVDNTRSKMGKARPWMFWSAFPLGLFLVLSFAIPSSMSHTAQYVYFFVVYTAANSIFYTANNIAYGTMSALITKNSTERVSLGSYRYFFAVVASILVSSITTGLVTAFGGGATGWRNVAIVFAIVMMIFSSLASLVCKEVPQTEEELKEDTAQISVGKKLSLWGLLKIVLTNRYYLILLAIYLLLYTTNGLGGAIGVYYCQYVLGNAALLGVISMSALVMIVGLIANPFLVKKFGMYKVNLVSYIGTTVLSFGIMITAYMGSLPGILAFTFLRSVISAPLFGSLNAMVAEVAGYTYRTKKIRAEGMMFSCSTVGLKIGSGLGSAICGWVLAAAGFEGAAQVQSASVLNMIKFGYGVIPLILTILMTVCLWAQKVVQANKKWDDEHSTVNVQ
jgi:GPH family glycoside/pentoside/hexuronide:cation symporter